MPLAPADAPAGGAAPPKRPNTSAYAPCAFSPRPNSVSVNGRVRVGVRVREQPDTFNVVSTQLLGGHCRRAAQQRTTWPGSGLEPGLEPGHDLVRVRARIGVRVALKGRVRLRVREQRATIGQFVPALWRRHALR